MIVFWLRGRDFDRSVFDQGQRGKIWKLRLGGEENYFDWHLRR